MLLLSCFYTAIQLVEIKYTSQLSKPSLVELHQHLTTVTHRGLLCIPFAGILYALCLYTVIAWLPFGIFVLGKPNKVLHKRCKSVIVYYIMQWFVAYFGRDMVEVPYSCMGILTTVEQEDIPQVESLLPISLSPISNGHKPNIRISNTSSKISFRVRMT